MPRSRSIRRSVRTGRLPLAACCAALLGAGSALAALPPGAQRAREIVAVVEAAAPRLSQPIDAVRLVEPYRYEVQGGACSLEVRIIALPPKLDDGSTAPGPMPFRAVAGEPDCRP